VGEKGKYREGRGGGGEVTAGRCPAVKSGLGVGEVYDQIVGRRLHLGLPGLVLDSVRTGSSAPVGGRGAGREKAKAVTTCPIACRLPGSRPDQIIIVPAVQSRCQRLGPTSKIHWQTRFSPGFEDCGLCCRLNSC